MERGGHYNVLAFRARAATIHGCGQGTAAHRRRHFLECGAYNYWTYGSSTSRQPIDYLEGDAVLRAAQELGHSWHRKVVPVYIDNSAFERSLHKGRSKAPRLNIILRQLFVLSVKHECIFETHWLASKDNVLADALSRGDLSRFKSALGEHFPGGVHLRRYGVPPI